MTMVVMMVIRKNTKNLTTVMITMGKIKMANWYLLMNLIWINTNMINKMMSTLMKKFSKSLNQLHQLMIAVERKKDKNYLMTLAFNHHVINLIRSVNIIDKLLLNITAQSLKIFIADTVLLTGIKVIMKIFLYQMFSLRSKKS